MCEYSEMFLNCVNDVECSVFSRDGNVDSETLEKLIISAPESCETLIVEVMKLLNCLPAGNYQEIYNGPFVRLLLGHDFDNVTDYESYLKEQVSNNLSSESKEVHYLRQLLILLLGISCLQLIIQQNWTGPPLHDSKINYLLTTFEKDEKVEILRDQSLGYLGKDGEDVYVLAEFPELLMMARIILVDCKQLLTDMKTQPLWELRCIFIHQQLLEEPSSSLKNKVFSVMERFSFDDKMFPRKVLCRISLELGYHLLQYYDVGKVKEQFEKAQKYLGLEIYLEGALGRRTKFQQIDYTQLMAKAKINDKKVLEDIVREIKDPEYLPKDVTLEDDTILNLTNFADPDSSLQEKLNPLHQAVILAACFYLQKSQARHELLEEELLANITLLLSQPQVWTVQTVALLLRSKLEKKSPRRKERSMMQVQQLVDQFSDPKAHLSHRLELFYSVLFPARWTLQGELAGLFRELGITKSALEIYERLHLWEDVVSCYVSLGRYEKAETVIRKQLSVKETPKLWCLLGDVTKNEEYYHKAWELSGKRSARAQRSLGYLCLRDKRFSESVPHFQKSLEINSLQENVWFSLGCAAMFVENLELATKAYHWCVSMNPDNSEAWNNLSSIYIKTNQKDRAFKTLQEALKANYENWHVWENFLLVSTDVGAFEEVISALHRLMDLKEKYIDVEVLGILVRAVVGGKEDRKGLSASRLKPRLKKLMGRITSRTTTNADVWKLYSDIYKDEGAEDEKEKFLQYLVKAHRVKIQTPGWEKTKDGTENVIQLTLQLSQAYRDASQSTRETAQSLKLLSSSKLNLKGLITKLKNSVTDLVTVGTDCSLNESLANLERELERTLSCIEILKSTGRQ